MNAQCPKCNTSHDVPDASVPAGGMSYVCPSCAHVFHISAGGGGRGQRAARYFVKRESGKVLGPFPSRVIQQMIRSKQLAASAEVSPDKASGFVRLDEHQEFAATFGEDFRGKAARTSKAASLGDRKDSTQAGLPVSSLGDLGGRARKPAPRPRPQVADLSMDDEPRIAQPGEELDWSLDVDDPSLGDIELPAVKRGVSNASELPAPKSAPSNEDDGEGPLQLKSMFDLPAIKKTSKRPPDLPAPKPRPGKGRETASYKTERATAELPAAKRTGSSGFPVPREKTVQRKVPDLPAPKGRGGLPAAKGSGGGLPSAKGGAALPSPGQGPGLPAPGPSSGNLPATGGTTPRPPGPPPRSGRGPSSRRPKTRSVQQVREAPTPVPEHIPVMSANELPFLGGDEPSDDLLDLGGGDDIPLMGRDDLPLFDDDGRGGDDLDDLLLGNDDGIDDADDIFALDTGSRSNEPVDDDPLGLGSNARTGGDSLLMGNEFDSGGDADDFFALQDAPEPDAGDPLGLDLGGDFQDDDPLGLGLDDGDDDMLGPPIGVEDPHSADVPLIDDEDSSTGGPSLAAPDSSRSSMYGYDDDDDLFDDDEIDLDLDDHPVHPTDPRPVSTEPSSVGKSPTSKRAKTKPSTATGDGGGRTKVLLIALVVLALVVVGLGFTPFGPFQWSEIFGGGEEAPAGGTQPKADGGETNNVTVTLEPSSLRVDDYRTYAEFVALAEDALAKNESPETRGLLLAGIAMKLLRYPSSAATDERRALGLLAAARTDPTSIERDFGLGAWLAYKADVEGSEPHLQSIAGKEELRYFGDLLRGVAQLQVAEASGGDERRTAVEAAIGHLNRATGAGGTVPEAHFLLGRAHELDGKPSQAERAYESAIENSPDHIGSRLALGRLRIVNGELESAREAYAPVTEKLAEIAAPSELGLALELDGRQALFRNDIDLAIAKFQEARTASPTLGSAIQGLGEAYVRGERFDDGISYFEETFGDAPQEAEAELALAKLNIGLAGEASDPSPLYERADELLEAGRRAHADDPRFAFLHGRLQEERGMLTEAESSFNTALDIEDDFQVARISLARLLAGKETPEATLRAGELVKDVQRSDLSVEAMTELARFFLEAPESAEDGVRLLNEAVTVNPSWVPAHELLVEYYVSRGELENAREHIDTLTRLNAMTPRLRYLNAKAQYQSGDLSVAAEMMQDVVEEAPENPEYAKFLGVVQFERGSFATAERYFEDAIRLNNEAWDARFYLGRVALAQGDELDGDDAVTQYEDALKVLQEVHDKRSTNAEYHYYLALALEKVGRGNEAMKQYKRMLSRTRFDDEDDPSASWAMRSPLPWHRRAGLSRLRARWSSAEEDLRKAIEIDPEYLPARADLSRVLYESGSPATAAVELEALKEKTEGDMEAELYFLLGMSYLGLDKPSEVPKAVAALEQARDRGYADTGASGIIGVLDPADLHRTLGLLYRDLGRRGDAVRELETFLAKAEDLDGRKRREIEKEILDLR